jgi:hypothetical protein
MKARSIRLGCDGWPIGSSTRGSARSASTTRSGAWLDDGAVSTAAWVREHCRVAHGVARATVDLARTLESLPETSEAFAAGDISRRHAEAIANACTSERRDVMVEIESALVDAARVASPRELRGLVQRVTDAIDGDGGVATANELHERRRLHVSPTLHGMVAIDGLLDPESGELVLAALDAVMSADRDPGDIRTKPQRRADALVQLCAGERPATNVSVILDLETLERRGGVEAAMQARGEAEHVGALSAETLRRLTCDAGVARVITQGHSEPLDVGRSTRTISPAMRRALVVRDGGCRFPGCDRPPGWCDAHHKVHWADGGETRLDNLVLLCRRHHRAVHEGGSDP